MKNLIKGIILGSALAVAVYEGYQVISKKAKAKKEDNVKKYTEFKDGLLKDRDLNKEVEELLSEDKFTAETRVWFDEYLERHYKWRIDRVPCIITDKSYDELQKYLNGFDKFMHKMKVYDKATLEAFMAKKQADAERDHLEMEKRQEREAEEKKARMISNAIKYFGDTLISGNAIRNSSELDKLKLLSSSILDATKIAKGDA